MRILILTASKSSLLKNWKMEPIIIDTRETLAYNFAWILSSKPKPAKSLIYKKLDTCDYSLQGYENQVGIERKTLSDAFGSFGRNRKRLQREFERMSKFDYAAMVIESSLGNMFKNPPEHSQMTPKSVFRSLLSWSIKYNVFVWPCPDRAFAEKTTYFLLENYSKAQYLKKNNL